MFVKFNLILNTSNDKFIYDDRKLCLVPCESNSHTLSLYICVLLPSSNSLAFMFIFLPLEKKRISMERTTVILPMPWCITKKKFTKKKCVSLMYCWWYRKGRSSVRGAGGGKMCWNKFTSSTEKKKILVCFDHANGRNSLLILESPKKKDYRNLFLMENTWSWDVNTCWSQKIVFDMWLKAILNNTHYLHHDLCT